MLTAVTASVTVLAGRESKLSTSASVSTALVCRLDWDNAAETDLQQSVVTVTEVAIAAVRVIRVPRGAWLAQYTLYVVAAVKPEMETSAALEVEEAEKPGCRIALVDAGTRPSGKAAQYTIPLIPLCRVTLTTALVFGDTVSGL